jgi:TRAP-type C4-dicarboxylate transport system permease small subunit
MRGDGALQTVETIVHATARVANSLGMIALVLMMLVTVIDVFLRSAFNRPILGVVELAEYAMVAVVYLALPLCAFRAGHARVETLSVLFPPGLLRIVDIITSLLSLGILSLMTWQAFLEFGNMLEAKRASDMLGMPAYPFYLIVALGSLILAFVLVVILLRLLQRSETA